MKLAPLFLFAVFGLNACDDGPYLKHDMKSEKIGDNCGSISPQISVTVNTIGDRFVYERCLEAGFANAHAVERKGDTVVVTTGASSSAKTSLYRITLDINTYPEYHYLALDGEVMPVHTSR